MRNPIHRVAFLLLLPRSIPVENFEDHSAPPSPDEKDSGFFMLRKDSERRATLHHILTEDGDKVVANLMEALAQVGGVEKRESNQQSEYGCTQTDTSISTPLVRADTTTQIPVVYGCIQCSVCKKIWKYVN